MGAAFLYCIGAAKAGTTWLSRALRSHDQATLPPIKETHYFDSLENGTSVWALDQLIRVRNEVRGELADAVDERARTRVMRRVQDIDRWLALVGAQRRNDVMYEKLMQRPVGPAHRIVADVTPAYALLGRRTYARMAALNGGDTRFLMILRDPIDRLWSNISMTVARRVAQGNDPDVVQARLMDEVLNDSAAPERARSDYAGTLARLDAAVPAPQRLVVFFEDVFQPATLHRVADFLGLDTPLTGPRDRVNAGQGAPIPAADHARLAALLRPQYDAIQTRLGAIPQYWQDNLAHDPAQTRIHDPAHTLAQGMVTS